MNTNARYVFWLGCAYPPFGTLLLQSVPKALKAMKLSLSRDEKKVLNGFLNREYILTGSRLLEGVCRLESRMPDREEVQAQIAPKLMVPRGKIPPPPPPPWG